MCDQSYEVMENIDFLENQMFVWFNYNCDCYYLMS